MSILIKQRSIDTSHGSLAVEEVGQGGIPVLLIHGNSTCRDVFRHQLEGRLAENHHFIAFDLPGHGESSNAPDPMRTYTRSGLADAAIELLKKLGETEVIVFGWSLGGHVGMEMLTRFPGTRGLMITGAPPVGPHTMAQGFKSTPQHGVAGKPDLSEADIDAFIQAMFGASARSSLHDAMVRADGRFRKRLFDAVRAGEGVDQRLIVESSPVPLAVVNGGADGMINLDYFDTIAYANLWESHCHRLPGAGHAPFWEASDDFNPVLERFLRDVENCLGGDARVRTKFHTLESHRNSTDQVR